MKRYALLFVLFFAMVAGTRLPYMPGQLFSFDEVNMVYAMDKLDTRLSQPQPPGYPLFILEMHAMKLLRVVRPESNLIALGLLGSAASMVALVWCGDRMFGGWTGIYAALFLWLYPAFWYAGLTSALRIHLALISGVVAGACWRAWHGERRWEIYSAMALGLGSGIRPEVGPLLFPLWVVAMLRSGFNWKARGIALVTLVASVFVWLTPLALGSGGFAAFFRHCWAYLAVQSATTSTLFGLEATRWLTNSILLVVWTFAGLAFVPMLALLARGAEDSIGRERWLFLATWLVPSVLFAAFVHVADAGHVLAMVVPFCLILGHQVSRAVSMSATWNSPTWNWVLPVVILARNSAEGPEAFRLQLLGTSLAAATLARLRWGKNSLWLITGRIGRANAACLILLPVLVFFAHAFLAKGWDYNSKPELTAERLWLDVKYGFHLSSYKHVKESIDPDDASIRYTQQVVAQAPAGAVILSERSVTSWRKVSYYLPRVRLVVLEKLPVRPVQFVATEWLRSQETRRKQGAAPVKVLVPAGTRLVWMIKPNSDFETLVRQNLPVTSAGPVFYTDLPKEAGSKELGGFTLIWEKPTEQ